MGLLFLIGSIAALNVCDAKTSTAQAESPEQEELAWANQSSRNNPSKKTKQFSAAGDWGAIGFFGEIAPRNFRGSATYGVYFTPTGRFKVTGEYLTQQLDFNYESGNKKKWVSQYAIGGEYQYLTKSSRIQSLEIGTAYNHAFNHDLGKKGIFERRVAGSDASLSFVGATAKLWDCSSLSLALDYDWVKFDRKFQDDKKVNGLGGTVRFTQQFAKDFSFNFGAEFRRPFTSYQGLLSWNHAFSSVRIDCGLFGNLTYGDHGVRTIQTGGIRLGLSFGPKARSCGRLPTISSHARECYAREYCSVSQWVSTPAVYVPIVLAIAEERKTCDISSTNPGAQVLTQALLDITLPPSYIHSSLPVTYSIIQDGGLSSGNFIDFDPVTGVLQLTYGGENNQIVNVTVTATSSCGSTSQTFQINFGGI